MKFYHRNQILLSALMIALSLSCGAFAAPLAPGEVVSGLALAGLDRGGGTQDPTILDSFVVPGSFNGFYLSTVITGDANNPLGGLTFMYQFLNEGLSANSIGRIAIDGFGTLPVDVSYDSSPGIAPAMASRDPSGDVIGFNFIPLVSNPATGFLAPGKSSPILFVRTAATAYTLRTASLIDGGGTSVPVFVPVPEPSSLALLAVGVLGILTQLGRRSQRPVRSCNLEPSPTLISGI